MISRVMLPQEIALLREKFVAISFKLDGYNVHQVIRHRRFRRSRKYPRGRWFNMGEDIFKTDIIAKKIKHKTIWIQVASGSLLQTKVKAFEKINCFEPLYEDIVITLAVKQKTFPEVTSEEREIISQYGDKYDLDLITMMETVIGVKWLTYGMFSDYKFKKLGNFWIPEPLLKIIIDHDLL